MDVRAFRGSSLVHSLATTTALVIGCDGAVVATDDAFVPRDAADAASASDGGRDAPSNVDAPLIDAFDAPLIDAFESIDGGSDAPLPDAFLEIDSCTPVTFHADCDGDGFTPADATTIMACAAPDTPPSACPAGTWRMGASSEIDCDDGCASCAPGGTEVCDGLDQDCVLGVDNGVLLTFYVDCDGDGFTEASPRTTEACEMPGSRPSGCERGVWRRSASPADMADCRDNDAQVSPGAIGYFVRPTSSVPGTFDYDCDMVVERALTETGGACPPVASGGVCGVTGWEGESIPGCGTPGTWVECERGGSAGMPGVFFCVGSTSTRVQGCR